MTEPTRSEAYVQLDVNRPVWSHFYMVAPLVLIGSREGDHFDMAPKHMVTALSYDNYFGFVCTPRHSTYSNILEHRGFTVSFPRPDQVVLSSLSATARTGDDTLPKPILDKIPTELGKQIEAPLLLEAAVHLECELDRIVDDFGENSLIAGKILRASVHPDYHLKEERDEHDQIHQNPLLAYLAYGRFASIRHSHAFPFPKSFKR